MPANILVVEDEPAIQELVAVNLEHAGHQVWRASSAEEADTMVRDALPDVILLDWMLPGTSGLAYARRLRGAERTRRIPIIMLTARAEERDKLEWAGERRGRLPHQTVFAEGAARAHQGSASAPRTRAHR